MIAAHDIKNAEYTLSRQIIEAEEQPHIVGDSMHLCTLKGAFMFFGSMMKKLGEADIKAYVDFIQVNSYIGQEKGENVIVNNLIDHIPESIQRIYIYDDILDTGETAKLLGELLYEEYDLCFVALCKREGVDHSYLDHYYYSILSGIDVPENDWLVGYGMDDDNGFGRNMTKMITV